MNEPVDRTDPVAWYKRQYEQLSKDFTALRANLDIYKEQLEQSKETNVQLKRIADALHSSRG